MLSTSRGDPSPEMIGPRRSPVAREPLCPPGHRAFSVLLPQLPTSCLTSVHCGFYPLLRSTMGRWLRPAVLCAGRPGGRALVACAPSALCTLVRAHKPLAPGSPLCAPSRLAPHILLWLKPREGRRSHNRPSPRRQRDRRPSSPPPRSAVRPTPLCGPLTAELSSPGRAGHGLLGICVRMVRHIVRPRGGRPPMPARVGREPALISRGFGRRGATGDAQRRIPCRGRERPI
jgi:hypothetical protein